jgi:hypothetical protein
MNTTIITDNNLAYFRKNFIILNFSAREITKHKFMSIYEKKFY